MPVTTIVKDDFGVWAGSGSFWKEVHASVSGSPKNARIYLDVSGGIRLAVSGRDVLSGGTFVGTVRGVVLSVQFSGWGA